MAAAMLFSIETCHAPKKPRSLRVDFFGTTVMISSLRSGSAGKKPKPEQKRTEKTRVQIQQKSPQIGSD